MKKLALCGFMGCGKTTVASALSKNHGLSHIDTDKFIEEKENITITEMFKNHSEAYFREKESEVIKTLSQKDSYVLSLGGGAVMFDKNVKALKENGYTIVFIDTDLSILKERLLNDTQRPLLNTNDIDDLYNKRLSTYQSICDIKVTVKNESGEQIADMIMQELKKKA
ncbi:MAG: shikimate kinase [Ruminococcaceae bacterium]|nr:shikimate kinase [Oscillospiraceae bacterium]